jgi:hypothetical protein
MTFSTTEEYQHHQPPLLVWGEVTDRHSHPPPLQGLQGPPEPGIRQPLWTTQPPDRPEQATANHQSHRVCRTSAVVGKWGSQTRS